MLGRILISLISTVRCFLRASAAFFCAWYLYLPKSRILHPGGSELGGSRPRRGPACARARGGPADIGAGRVDKLDIWSVDGLVDAGAPPIGRKLRRSPYDVSSPLNERRLGLAS